MDPLSAYALITLISVIGFVIGAVLFIVSLVLTAVKKKKFVWGIIGGLALIIAGAVFFVYGVINTARVGIEIAQDFMPTEFTPAEGSRVVSGTLKVDGYEVTMPCTVNDLQLIGYKTDYYYFGHGIDMWLLNDKNQEQHFPAYLDNSYGYENQDRVSGEDQVAAIIIKCDSGVTFEFNDLKFYMKQDELINRYGTPAYKIDDSNYGNYLYYLGENDTIYRFQFDSNKYLVSIMYGTSDFMKDEMNWLYHG